MGEKDFELGEVQGLESGAGDRGFAFEVPVALCLLSRLCFEITEVLVGLCGQALHQACKAAHSGAICRSLPWLDMTEMRCRHERMCSSLNWGPFFGL